MLVAYYFSNSNNKFSNSDKIKRYNMLEQQTILYSNTKS